MAVFVADGRVSDDVLGFGPGWQVAFGELVAFPVDGHVYRVHSLVYFPYIFRYQAAASDTAPGVPATRVRKSSAGTAMSLSVSRMKTLFCIRSPMRMVGASMVASSGGVRMNSVGVSSV